MNTDLESLRKLVAEWRELSKPKGPVREENPISKGWRDASFAHANQLESALSRLLEAQAGVPAEWLNKVARYTRHGVMAYPGTDEQWIRADAIDALIEDAARAHPPSEGKQT